MNAERNGHIDDLRGIRFFENITGDAYDQITRLIRWKTYGPGSEIIPYRDTGDDVYFVAMGRVRVTSYSYSGKEIAYQDLLRGDIFGELSALDGKPRSANVITLEPSIIGSLPRKNFRVLIREHPEVAESVLKRLVSMVRFLCDRVYQYGALDVKDRVRAEILRLARENMHDDNSATIDRLPTHAEIASRTNTHREAVTRELNELSRMGLITQDKRTLSVKDVSRLAELLPDSI